MNNHVREESDTCKVQLTLAINFISSKDVEDMRVMQIGLDKKEKINNKSEK